MSSAKAWMDFIDARSRCLTTTFSLDVSETISALACPAFFRLRQAKMTRAPAESRSSSVTYNFTANSHGRWHYFKANVVFVTLFRNEPSRKKKKKKIGRQVNRHNRNLKPRIYLIFNLNPALSVTICGTLTSHRKPKVKDFVLKYPVYFTLNLNPTFISNDLWDFDFTILVS